MGCMQSYHVYRPVKTGKIPGWSRGLIYNLAFIIQRVKCCCHLFLRSVLIQSNMHGILIAQNSSKKSFAPLTKVWTPVKRAETKFITAMIGHFGLSGKFCFLFLPAPIVVKSQPQEQHYEI